MEMERSFDRKLNNLENYFSRLEGIRDAIVKYGISQSMMMAFDPDRTFVKSGYCCAYEELNEIPEKGEQADAVVEGIGLVLLVGFAIYVLFFRKKAVKLDELQDHSTKTNEWLKDQLNIIYDVYKESKDIDATIFKDIVISVYSKDDFFNDINLSIKLNHLLSDNKLANIILKLVDAVINSKYDDDLYDDVTHQVATYFNSLGTDKQAKLLIGILKGDEVDHENDATYLYDETHSLGDIGWELSDISKIYERSMVLLSSSDSLIHSISFMQSTFKKVSSELETYSKKNHSDLSNTERAAIKKSIVKVRDLAQKFIDVFETASQIDYIIKMGMRVIRAANKAGRMS